jgi:hypothetical protein
MTKSIYLDSSKTALLEPHEGDSQNGQWISPFEVPIAVRLSAESPASKIRSIRFEYTGGETGEPWSTLDETGALPVRIRHGRHSGKVLEMTFASPISVNDLPKFADRLRVLAHGTQVLATRFNYLMIAAIFQHWNEVTAQANE